MPPGASRIGPCSWIRATYRRRFGIESSYRQSHQARIRTSSRKPALRLLFMGVALVLRNVWVWLHAEVMAQPQRGAQTTAAAIAALCPLAVVADDGGCQTLSSLKKNPCLSRLIREGSGVWYRFQLLSVCSIGVLDRLC